jgi:hypothetical protein
MIVTTLRSLTAVSSSMPGEYTRLRTSAPGITIWSASLSAIVVSTLPLLTPTSTPLDVTIPTQALQAALKALRGDDVTIAHTTTTLKLTTPHSNAEISIVGSVVNYIPVADDLWRDVDGDELARGLRAIEAAIATGDVNNAGVRFCPDGVIATDTCRLHWWRWDSEAAAVPSLAGTILPDTAAVVLSALTRQGSGKTTKGRGKSKTAAAPPVTRYATGQRFIVIDTPTSRVYCRRLLEPWAPWERIAKGEVGDAVVVKVMTKPLLDALRSIPADFVGLSSEGGDSGLCLDYTTPTGRGRLVVDASTPPLPPIRHRVRYLVDALACCGDEVTMTVSASAATRIESGRFVGFVMYAVG